VLERSVAVGVVHAALVGIGQGLVRLLALLEGGFGGGITRIAVRVELHRATAIGLLQFFFAGGAGHAQHFVIVALAHNFNRCPAVGCRPRHTGLRRSGSEM